ncbi:MAG TPA: PRC-barrel domain-containing protein [Streptosporangiaceae bacterium]|jgi:sporulation protein YlmC with PRC-barrel domain
MAGTTQFTIGAKASCSDGEAGVLTEVVVDPVARAVTHLAIEPPEDDARLVPLALVHEATPESIRLGCTLAEFGKLDPAEKTRFLPGGVFGDYGPEQVLTWPYYGLALNDGPVGVGPGIGLAGALQQEVTTDTLPLGEVGIRRDDQVHATDGDIGRVQGLVIDAASHHVTHVLLQEGHLWGRKDVAIPIGAVTGIEDVIQLKLSKQEVHDLPAVDIKG